MKSWIRNNVDYGRKLMGTGVQGAHSGRDEFLGDKPVAPFLAEAALRALPAAAAGVCLGLLTAGLNRRKGSPCRIVGGGLLGGALGFGAGMSWKTHRLAARMGRGALRKLSSARAERWLETHPIDYA